MQVSPSTVVGVRVMPVTLRLTTVAVKLDREPGDAARCRRRVCTDARDAVDAPCVSFGALPARRCGPALALTVVVYCLNMFGAAFRDLRPRRGTVTGVTECSALGALPAYMVSFDCDRHTRYECAVSGVLQSIGCVTRGVSPDSRRTSQAGAVSSRVRGVSGGAHPPAEYGADESCGGSARYGLAIRRIRSSPRRVYYLWRPNLQDEADNMFVELAVASESSHLITHNTRDFVSGSELKHDSFRVVTPYLFLVEWRKSHGK